jgi:gluconokinase
MGPSGSGKSTVGSALAATLGARFLDADDLHPPRNVERMRAGIPLVDDDRWPWLDAVAAEIARLGAAGDAVVCACSALRRAYRDRLRRGVPGLLFLELTGSTELLGERLRGRSDHFMPPTLLGTQIATLESLEPDEQGFPVGIAADVDDEVREAVEALRSKGWQPLAEPPSRW